MGNNRAARHIAAAKKALDDNGGLTIIIPAAGMGRRMKSHGPKALLLLNRGVPLLERQLKILWAEHPNADIIVTIGFQDFKIRKAVRGLYPARFVSNPYYESANIAYSLRLAMQVAITRHVLIVYGDLVFNNVTVRGITSGLSAMLVDTKERFKDEEVGVQIHDDVVTNLSYGLKHKWGQMVYLTGKELAIFEETIFNDETGNWFGYEVLNNVINRGGMFEAFEPPRMKIVEVDTVRDLEQARML